MPATASALTPSNEGATPGSNRIPTTDPGRSPSAWKATRSGPAIRSPTPSQSRSMHPSGTISFGSSGPVSTQMVAGATRDRDSR